MRLSSALDCVPFTSILRVHLLMLHIPFVLSATHYTLISLPFKHCQVLLIIHPIEWFLISLRRLYKFKAQKTPSRRVLLLPCTHMGMNMCAGDETSFICLIICSVMISAFKSSYQFREERALRVPTETHFYCRLNEKTGSLLNWCNLADHVNAHKLLRMFDCLAIISACIDDFRCCSMSSCH